MDSSNLNFLIWNIRGAVNARGKRRVKELIRTFHPQIFVLLETHCPFQVVETFWKNLGYDFVAGIEARGHSGGIWILVAQNKDFTIQPFDVHPQIVSMTITRGGRRWINSFVYASPNPQQRDLLWDYLTDLRVKIHDPWMLIGDFNDIASISEVVGGSFSYSRATKKLNMMEAFNLLDLGSTGSKYTWSRKNNNGALIAKRLDRAIADVRWRHVFPEAYVEHLARVYSDHRPLLVRFQMIAGEKKHRPFRFYASRGYPS
jgi:exonuclease III